MEVGDIFALPLQRGWYAAGRIIERNSGTQFVLIDSFWDRPPRSADVEDEDLMALLFGETTALRANVFKGWFRGVSPYEVVVHAPLRPHELELRGSSGTTIFQSPAHMATSVFNQWRWLNERPQFHADETQRLAKLAARNQHRKVGRSLKKMARETPFASWRERLGDTIVASSHGVFTAAIAELIHQQAKGDPGSRAAVLRGIIDRFNDLDRHNRFIETVEREEIVRRIKELASLVGVTEDLETLTGDREW